MGDIIILAWGYHNFGMGDSSEEGGRGARGGDNDSDGGGDDGGDCAGEVARDPKLWRSR